MTKIMRYLCLFAIIALSAVTLTALPSAMSGKRDLSLVDQNLPEKEFLKAIESLTDEQVQTLTTRETEAYKRAPLEFQALQNISVLAGLKKNTDQQIAISLLVPSFTKRNITAQLTAANIHVSRGRYKEAFYHLDSMLRAHPEIGKDVFSIFSTLVLQKKGEVELAQLLKKEPPWRAQLFEHILSSDSERRAGYALLTAIRKEKGDVRDTEVRSLIYASIKAKEMDQAYFVWLDFLPTQDLRLVGLIFDGGFDREPKNHIFDWNIVHRQNAKIAVEDRRGASSDRNLVLDFFNDKGAFDNLFQYLKLPVGKYRISYEQMSQNLKTEGGLQWNVRCLNGTELGRSAKINTTGPWAKYEMEVEVPTIDCETQVIGLQSISTAALDTLISGQLYFDNFKIVPANAPAAEPQN